MHQGQRIQIELQRNDRLLPDAHFLRYQNASNQEEGASGYVVRNFTKTDIDLCHYQVNLSIPPSLFQLYITLLYSLLFRDIYVAFRIQLWRYPPAMAASMASSSMASTRTSFTRTSMATDDCRMTIICSGELRRKGQSHKT